MRQYYYKEPMYCPICERKLVVLGQDRLETLEEHIFDSDVSLKDRYECLNADCYAFDNLFWDEGGSRFGGIGTDKVLFIDKNDAPFGSFQRRMNVEIYKKDENTSFTLGKLRIERCWWYKSDCDGNILKRGWKIQLWYDRVLYISGIHMLIFSIKLFHRQLKAGIDKGFKPLAEWEKKDWWRRWVHQYKKVYFLLTK